MRIQHNIAALSASNYLKSNDSAISKNIQKLSSGYRINSAADDAAGLAVSEKMRSQINGLTQAQDNAQNGIALVQTAEGGLNETSAILQRMNTLAVESSNGTYQSDTDRTNLQKEVTALQSEIDTISSSTNFNQISLLNGDRQYNTYTVAAALTADGVMSSVSLAGGNLASGVALTATLTTGATYGSISVTAGTVTGLTFSSVTNAAATGTSYTIQANVDYTAAGADQAALQQYEGLTITFTTSGTYDHTSSAATGAVTTTSANGVLSLQVGSDNKDDQRIHIAVGDMSSAGLGVDKVDISTQEGAQKAIDTIKNAINTVSAARADLGAAQNQLEHTSNNLSTMTENLTSAESQIRDVDMSDEYVQYSKNQILSQAATSMLAQANVQPQNVLTLLKG